MKLKWRRVVFAFAVTWVTGPAEAGRTQELQITINRAIENGAQVHFELDDRDLRFQYTHHQQGPESGLCERERIYWVDLETRIKEINYDMVDDKTIALDVSFEQTFVDLKAYGKNRFLCQWMGGEVQGEIERVDFSVDVEVIVPDTFRDPLEVRLKPQDLQFTDVHITSSRTAAWLLDDAVKRIVNKYSRRFFKSEIGQKLTSKIEGYVNQYLAKNDILLVDY